MSIGFESGKTIIVCYVVSISIPSHLGKYQLCYQLELFYDAQLNNYSLARNIGRMQNNKSTVLSSTHTRTFFLNIFPLLSQIDKQFLSHVELRTFSFIAHLPCKKCRSFLLLLIVYSFVYLACILLGVFSSPLHMLVNIQIEFLYIYIL